MVKGMREELYVRLEASMTGFGNNHVIEEIQAPQHLKPHVLPGFRPGFQWRNYLSERTLGRYLRVTWIGSKTSRPCHFHWWQK